MFRLLRSKLSHGASFKLKDPTAASPFFLLPFQLQTTNYATASTVDTSLTLHFLQSSCYLTPDAAAAAAEKVHLKNTKNAHAVLALLRDYGFSGPQIANLVSRRPSLLAVSPGRTLKPKLEFLRSEVGLSRTELPKILSNSSLLLFCSVEKRLAPNLAILRSILCNQVILPIVLRRGLMLLTTDGTKLLPRIEALRSYGATEAVISTLFRAHPWVFAHPRFDVILDRIKRIAIRPSKASFAHALRVLSILTQSTWDDKVVNFERLGWSEEQVLNAFVRHPFCMSACSDKVRRNMEFFAEKLGWTPEYVSSNPVVLSLSFEKRIMPRYLVLAFLASKGLIEDNVKATHLMKPNNWFLERYVIKYSNEWSELKDIVKMEFQGFEMNSLDSIELLRADY
ncbi:hypothetical protein Cni_G00735 [Canna indica]|uniref:Mitochondrial transcription termination factor n=1 Tax=Canna indica TaxID=4628 RepID=A0AAQ3JLD9_9LILI|nr:hypothetical protein Cni_G00735 [Canna indica]